MTRKRWLVVPVKRITNWDYRTIASMAGVSASTLCRTNTYFLKKGEVGSEGWNDFKMGYGFKLHLLIDCETQFPIALIVTNGLANDMTLAIPLLKRARYWLKRCGYVLADKGYDWGDIVNWIVKKIHAKAGIPIRKVGKRGKNYTWEGAWRNYQYKAKERTL